MADTSNLAQRDHLPLGLTGRIPLGHQVLAGVGALFVLVAAAVALAVVLVQGLGSGAAELTAREVEYARAIDAAALRAKAMANDERGFLLSASDSFMERFELRTERVRTSFATALRAADDRQQRAAVTRARSEWERWVGEVRAEVAAFRAGDEEGAVTTSLGPVRDLRLSFEASLAQAQRLGASAIESGAESVSTTSNQSIVILLIYLGVALLVAAAVAVWLVRTILRPVYALLAIFAEPGSSERLVERYSRAAR